MLSHNTNLKAPPHLENIPDLIAGYREQSTDGSTKNLADNLQLSPRTVNAWRLGGQVPQIESLMRLCYCCGVSLYDLFALRSETLNLNKLKIRSLPDIPNPTGKRRRRIPFDAVHIQQNLEAILASEEQPPPAMRTVAQRLNYSPRELREHFPVLCRTISSRRKDYYRVRCEQKYTQMKDEVRQATLEIHSQGIYPSSNKVGSLLSEPGVMRDPVIFKFWHEILQELEQTN